MGMRRRPPTLTAEDASIRFAWWVAFLATLALVAALDLAKSAQAAAPAGAPGVVAATAPLAVEADEAETGEDEDFEFDECEADEECEGEENSLEAPEECLLSSAEATVFATADSDKVRLQIRYTTTAPIAVAVTYGLHGSKGSLSLGDEKKKFAKQGVLRLTRELTEDQMAKVMAAKGFTVRLRVAAAPSYCKAFFDHQLDIKRATPSGLAWEQSE
jgi:hypothetical protein